MELLRYNGKTWRIQAIESFAKLCLLIDLLSEVFSPVDNIVDETSLRERITEKRGFCIDFLLNLFGGELEYWRELSSGGILAFLDAVFRVNNVGYYIQEGIRRKAWQTEPSSK